MSKLYELQAKDHQGTWHRMDICITKKEAETTKKEYAARKKFKTMRIVAKTTINIYGRTFTAEQFKSQF